MRPRDAAYSTLKRRIVLNELKPGDIVTELGLAQDLACSQGTIREAMLRLQEDGLLIRNGHRGTSVTPLDPEETEEILAVRRRLELRGGLRLARMAHPNLENRLREIQDQMNIAAVKADEYALIEHDTEFHMTLFHAAGLRALEQILRRCILHSHRQKLWEPRHRRTLIETAHRHLPIIDAVKSGDGERLAAALGYHIDTIVQVTAEKIAS